MLINAPKSLAQRIHVDLSQADTAASARDARLLKGRGVSRPAYEGPKPVQGYRDEELAHMGRNFRGFDSDSDFACCNFIHEALQLRTRAMLAHHRPRRSIAIGAAS